MNSATRIDKHIQYLYVYMFLQQIENGAEPKDKDPFSAIPALLHWLPIVFFIIDNKITAQSYIQYSQMGDKNISNDKDRSVVYTNVYGKRPWQSLLRGSVASLPPTHRSSYAFFFLSTDQSHNSVPGGRPGRVTYCHGVKNREKGTVWINHRNPGGGFGAGSLNELHVLQVIHSTNWHKNSILIFFITYF